MKCNQKNKYIYLEAAVAFSVVLGVFLWEWCGMLQAQPVPSLVLFPRLVWDAAEDQELGSSLPCCEKGKSLPGWARVGGLVVQSSAGGLCEGSPELFWVFLFPLPAAEG